jgi:hypothetical protein
MLEWLRLTACFNEEQALL